MTEPDGIAEQLADAPHTHEDRNNKRARKGRASRPGRGPHRPPGTGTGRPPGNRRLAAPQRGLLGRSLDSSAPSAGGAVMATGVVSIALSLDGQQTLSRIMLAIAIVIWAALAVLAPLRAARDPAGFGPMSALRRRSPALWPRQCSGFG